MRDYHQATGLQRLLRRFGASALGSRVLRPTLHHVDAVEANGWVLDRWSVNFDSGGTFNAFPLFRRRENFVPQDRT